VQTAPQAQGGGRPAQNQEEQRRREQPGSTQGAATTAETDAQPKFNMDYFVGEWTFESTVSESPLGAGGPMSGSETVRNMLDGRFWDVSIKGEGPDGVFTGRGVIMYQDGFFGQFFTRYEVTQGQALLRTVSVGGCASRTADGSWVLTNATNGVETKQLFMSAKEIEDARKLAPGSNRYVLVGTADFVNKEELLKQGQRAEFTRPQVANATGQ